MTRMLLVEDNEQSLYLLQTLLHGNGHETYSASNGAEALELARQNPPDLVVSDILMPVMDGFTLCREWKKDAQLSGIPFVFYTATYTDERDRELALSLGAARFIIKPTEPEEFMAILSDVVREAENGQLSTPAPRAQEEGQFLHQYNAALIRKLEEKMLQLERTNRALEEEVAERKRTQTQLERQYLETQRRVQQLTALRTIDLAISSSFDLRLTLDLILGQVSTQLGVDAADVQFFQERSQTLTYGAGRGFKTSPAVRAELQDQARRAAVERRIITIANLAQASQTAALKPLMDRENLVGYCVAPLVSKGRLKGILEVFTRRPLHPDGEWLGFMDALAGQAAIAIENAELFEGLQRSNAELALAYDTTLEGWSRALDLRDRETEGHTARVAKFTVELAKGMGINDGDLIHVHRGAILHDIGKMVIPDSILFKRGPLTEAEWKIMRQHPQLAYDMLSPIAYLRPSIDIPYCHHEKWDGTGYPRALKGDEIPLPARLFAVVDVYDALTSDRRYRRAMSKQEARDYIRTNAGKHFDSQAAEAFLQTIAA